RKGYRALLDQLERGVANGVLAWHTDRLHRSPVELERYIAVCEQRSVITHTVQAGPLDLATPSGRMVARQLGAVARYESEHKAERIRAARRQAAREGRWSGGVRPFGFEADGVTIRPCEAEVIVEATEAILGGESLRSVTRRVNATGLRTTFGRLDWDAISFKEVLIRPRNAGLMFYKGEEVGPASWPAIVSEDRWRALVAVLTDPRRKTSTSNRVRWLGSGIYLCGFCGKPSLRASTAGGGSRTSVRRPPAYRCREPGIGHVVRAAQPLDELVVSTILERLARPDACELLVPPDVDVDVNAVRAEADVLRTRLDALAVKFAEGAVTASQLQAGTDRLRSRLVSIESAIADVVVPSPLDGIAASVDPAAVWAQLDMPRRRGVLDALATVTVLPSPKGRRPDGGYFDPATVRINWKMTCRGR
ncbi:MAG: recombinase family protein, partial [Actinobacteria bacterium]|nr:recombinase family protein [Actinomycetota bacterium]